MFTTQKMFLLDILVLKKDMESVSNLIVQSGVIEPSVYSGIDSDKHKQWSTNNISEKKRILSDLKKNIDELLFYFTPYADVYLSDTQLYTIPEISDALRQYTLNKIQLEEKLSIIRKKKEEIAIRIAGLRMYLESQKNIQNKIQKTDFSDIYSMLGLINISKLDILKKEFHRFHGELLTEGHVNNSEIVFITVPSSQKESLISFLEQLYFINYGLPEEFFGRNNKNILDVSLEYTIVCDQEDILESEIKKIASVAISNLNHMLKSLNLYSKISEVQATMKQAGHFALLSGWIPAKNYKNLDNELKKLCGNNYELIISKTDSFDVQTDIPTQLNNPKWLKPFEELVTTFGIPNYREIDPTIFFSILYIFMYGAMFGDVGQGILLMIIGLIGKFTKKLPSFDMIFGLMIWVGISSTIFGLCYGSYFGYESTDYSWVPNPIWISPIHNINQILSYSIGLGIVVISFSYILSIINTFRMKDWSGLIFSHKGVFAFMMYVLLLGMGYSYFKYQKIPTFSLVIFSVLTLFLGLERVWEALIYKHGSIKDWWMGFFDMFEFFLSILTNTLSFVRIGAFALTHSALMTAVFTLRDLAGGNTLTAHITVILGNIFVIFMEGFIVGIQTLRLEYYEFFMRFFRGTGRVFNPIKYK